LQGRIAAEERERLKYLILSRRTPIRDARRISDSFLQTVGAERAYHDARGAEQGTNCPEWWHCDGCMYYGLTVTECSDVREASQWTWG
jgi:hypothetical protein